MFIDFLLVLTAAGGLLAALIAGFVATSHKLHPMLGLGIGLLGTVIFFTAYATSHRRKKAKERVLSQAHETEIATLTKRPWPKDKKWDVPCQSVVVPLIGVAATGVLTTSLIVTNAMSWPWIAFAASMDLITLLICMRMWIEGPVPKAILHAQGILIPGWGNLPWKSIAGIDYREITNRGRVVSRTLIFLVPDLHQYLHQAHWLLRMSWGLRRGKLSQVVQLRLSVNPIAPVVVSNVAYFLWNQATKQTHSWRADAPEDFNRALKIRAEILAKYSKPESLQNKDSLELKVDLARFNEAGEVVEKGSRKLARINNIFLVVVLVIFLMLIVAKLRA